MAEGTASTIPSGYTAVEDGQSTHTGSKWYANFNSDKTEVSYCTEREK